MPGVENWTENPLEVIQNVINHLPAGSCEASGIKEHFLKRLQSEEALSWVPSINSCALHDVPANSLVRYRCMVQDMFDPELYLAQYQVTNVKTGTVTMRSGRYKDIAECGCHEEIHMDAPGNVTRERMTLYCVPVPGEAAWVKDKRGLDDGGEEDANTETSRPRDASCTNATNGDGGQSKATAADGPQATASTSSNGEGNKLPDLNFPLPGEGGPACLVKVYEEDGDLKVNDVLEVVGVLSVDPAMVQFDQEEEGMSDASTAAEREAHTPPPSLVPRLHAVLIRKLVHNNPLLPRDLTPDQTAVTALRSEADQLRKELLSVLEHTLCGDALAAEYLLCHLVSSVGPLAAAGLAPLVHQLIASLTTQSHLLPLSLHNMNSLRLSPHKDYDANRLRSGQLQLSAGTHLTLDETALDTGRLDTQGVKNVTALGNAIQWQKVTYDFGFHTQDFVADLVVLVVSEGESFLPKDVHIPLRPQSVPSDLQQHMQQLDSRVTGDLLQRLRAFLTLCRHTEYTVSSDIQEALQEEFVIARKDNPSSMSVNDFHRLLSLVRLLTLSHCQSECTPQILNRALDMERERRTRIPPSPSAQSFTAAPATDPVSQNRISLVPGPTGRVAVKMADQAVMAN
ncbi:hypothetical protein BaRGS_00007928 [Batillaria attramentaria]|uniref:Mini-chromosome maintenance complex-binding protein n=1 Tax=Batillaria attramentaria TaxID=370345 RepID=A0ABD0LML2_9CAEN